MRSFSMISININNGCYFLKIHLVMNLAIQLCIFYLKGLLEPVNYIVVTHDYFSGNLNGIGIGSSIGTG